VSAQIPHRASTLRIRIGELRLAGASAMRAQRIAAELKRELARLASRGPLAAQLRQPRSAARLSAGAATLDLNARPEVAGRRLAALIADALSRGAQPPDDGRGGG
jgi:hypothetical protein